MVLLAACVAVLGGARADTEVIFAPLTAPGDMADALLFFRGYFEPWVYKGETLATYLRKYIRIGKGDIDDDGVPELFYFFDDLGWCGSHGCSLVIVQRRPSGLTEICGVEATLDNVRITDRVTVNGYRELKASFPILWHGDECIMDDPQIRDLQPDPDPLRK